MNGLDILEDIYTYEASYKLQNEDGNSSHRKPLQIVVLHISVSILGNIYEYTILRLCFKREIHFESNGFQYCGHKSCTKPNDIFQQGVK